LGLPAYLIDSAKDIRREWLLGKERIGITAGASAPESLVEQVMDRLREWGARPGRELVGRPERVAFSLPRELQDASRS
jgi:4-hydroxy-3-methylbut-2-enyl diphosphate reductase